ncbi:MAG: hypothetical protein DCF15_14725 [Phormidesmis priestleyi]|uniref:Putative restriction endonuclease domain-containing protein n=1 Tax=Phormidesmis priestleyi TaxID=268141 RepID=A0A2W4YXN6_9CYAN|nr:MAG: hypothetical protein DCF15_14725 [Phormidesmis priestleyi]
MIAQLSDDRLTPEEYLAFEAESPVKHEYIDGRAYAMSGTTDVHNVLSQNALFALRIHLKGSGCSMYMANVKAQLVARSNYYYPDIFVTCNPVDRETSNSKRFPKLIIEVLSDSTEAFDRGDKFVDYQSFESLEEYVLINTRHRRVEIFRRSEGSLWTLQIYQDKGDDTDVVVEFKSLELKVPLSVLYEDVALQQAV